MKLKIDRSELVRIVNLTQNIVQKKSSMPILANFLLEASKDTLKISASDLEITACLKAKANVEKNGSTTVNSKVFSDLVRELPEGEITLSLGDAERMEVSSEKHRTKLSVICTSSDSYPSLPGLGLEVSSRVSTEVLSEMLDKTLYAVSLDESKFCLNGVFLKTEEVAGKNQLTVVATDGHRLAIVKRPLDGIARIDGVILPRKGVIEFKRILDDASTGSTIGVGLNEGFFVADNQNLKMSMRMIQGEYPDYTKIIPKSASSTAKVSSQTLAQALKRASLMVSEKNKFVRMEFFENSLKLFSASPELGESSEELDLEYSAAPLCIGINPKYMLDVLSSLGDSKEISIDLNGQLGPIKIYSGSDSDCFAIIMPMRL